MCETGCNYARSQYTEVRFTTDRFHDDGAPRGSVGTIVEVYRDRPLVGAARYAAYAAGQGACVGHVAEHDLGAAAHAIKAARAAHPRNPSAGRVERDWQRDQLHEQIRALVLEDQARRNAICWSVFED
jgi:hypothetical protein